ncbi:MAG: Glutamine-dependent NAD(+) synthetase [Syntrophorhabdus sp. PtaB.Bin047]|nr:MAG: Glutamine-dependent NAD(+) synthetase [Syntrophorhabdus sp. PtaB.Bin047]
MEKMVRIGLGQMNSTVGDIRGNAEKVIKWVEKAKAEDVDILALPELAVTGYPPEDLLLKKGFVDANIRAVNEIASRIDSPATIVGFVDRSPSGIHNAAAVIYRGKIRGVFRKELLPNYGVFDEKRYFLPGTRPRVFRYGNVLFGIGICEDMWFKEGPIRAMARAGARLIFNINASPYHTGKIYVREDVVRRRIREDRVWVAYSNLVGGQDELVFDGQSFVMDRSGTVVASAGAFREDLLVVDIPEKELARKTRAAGVAGGRVTTVAARPGAARPAVKKPLAVRPVTRLGVVEEVYEALKLGLADYVGKNGFRGTVIGLSGGIDSALVAALAADALGRDNIVCVFMPSKFTSRESSEDAFDLAKRLGVRIIEVPIDPVFSAYKASLATLFQGLGEDVTEENLQARIRGNILMALSNKFGWLVLTTGNKSEMSVGYATLYGDMAGGFAVIKDVPKTLVYRLCAWRNARGVVIPERILSKEPTAELKADQKDRDSLPPYDHLDQVLKSYVEEDKEPSAADFPNLPAEEIARVLRMVDLSEYKRRQSPPGIKITPKAFGKDRRMPITNKYKGSQ